MNKESIKISADNFLQQLSQRKLKLIIAVLFMLLISAYRLNAENFLDFTDINAQSPPDTIKGDTLKALPTIDLKGRLEAQGRKIQIPGDSTGIELDSLSSDSTDTLASRVEKETIPLVSDTIAPPLPLTSSVRLTNGEFARYAYKDAGEALGILPGIYPRQTSFFGGSFYLVPPGGSGRDLLVIYKNRPFNDPVTGSMDFSSFAVEEMGTVDYSRAWSGSGPFSSNSVISIHSPHEYGLHPKTTVKYRQGFYGLGHVDWRITQKLSHDFRYHFGIDIGEYRGRRRNSSANTSQLRLGARQKLGQYGYLDFSWLQTRIRHGRAFYSGHNRYHRNDIDLTWLNTVSEDQLPIMVSGWYTRSERGFYSGSENGYRLGGALNFAHQADNHNLSFRIDTERIGALFGNYPFRQNPKGSREIYGITLSDKISSNIFSLDVSARGEAGTISTHPDGRGREILFKPGGSAMLDIGKPQGIGVLGLTSMGWRWPGLDESYGFWSINRPERFMDLVPLPDSAATYIGRGDLQPVGGIFTGGGLRWNQVKNHSARIMAGYRSYIDPISTQPDTNNVWTPVQAGERSGIEITGLGDLKIYGPFSIASAFTWTDLINEGEPLPEIWGWGSVRYENLFYNGQLRVRISLTSNYWGEYTHQDQTEEASWIHNGLISIKIMNFEFYWGTNNIFSNLYEYQPGYASMFREEIWGVRWNLLD